MHSNHMLILLVLASGVLGCASEQDSNEANPTHSATSNSSSTQTPKPDTAPWYTKNTTGECIDFPDAEEKPPEPIPLASEELFQVSTIKTECHHSLKQIGRAARNRGVLVEDGTGSIYVGLLEVVSSPHLSGIGNFYTIDLRSSERSCSSFNTNSQALPRLIVALEDKVSFASDAIPKKEGQTVVNTKRLQDKGFIYRSGYDTPSNQLRESQATLVMNSSVIVASKDYFAAIDTLKNETMWYLDTSKIQEHYPSYNRGGSRSIHPFSRGSEKGFIIQEGAYTIELDPCGKINSVQKVEGHLAPSFTRKLSNSTTVRTYTKRFDIEGPFGLKSFPNAAGPVSVTDDKLVFLERILNEGRAEYSIFVFDLASGTHESFPLKSWFPQLKAAYPDEFDEASIHDWFIPSFSALTGNQVAFRVDNFITTLIVLYDIETKEIRPFKYPFRIENTSPPLVSELGYLVWPTLSGVTKLYVGEREADTLLPRGLYYENSQNNPKLTDLSR